MLIVGGMAGVDGGPMKLLLLRHGPVDVPAGLCYGRLDVPFHKPSAAWIAAARLFVKNYLSADFQCWSSPSSRAQHIAELLAGSAGAVHCDERLSELNFGVFEGRLWQNIPPEESLEWTNNAEVHPCPGGESYAALKNRVQDWLKECMAEGRNALTVCHGGPIRAVLQSVLGVSWPQLFQIPVDFASYTGLRISGEMITLDFSNQILPGYTGIAL